RLDRRIPGAARRRPRDHHTAAGVFVRHVDPQQPPGRRGIVGPDRGKHGRTWVLGARARRGDHLAFGRAGDLRDAASGRPGAVRARPAPDADPGGWPPARCAHPRVPWPFRSPRPRVFRHVRPDGSGATDQLRARRATARQGRQHRHRRAWGTAGPRPGKRRAGVSRPEGDARLCQPARRPRGRRRNRRRAPHRRPGQARRGRLLLHHRPRQALREDFREPGESRRGRDPACRRTRPCRCLLRWERRLGRIRRRRDRRRAGHGTEGRPAALQAFPRPRSPRRPARAPAAGHRQDRLPGAPHALRGLRQVMQPMMNIAPLDAEVFGLDRETKRSWLTSGLAELTRHHVANCEAYARIVESVWKDGVTDLESVPWLPVRLFKLMDLRSIPAEQVARTLVSSGTSGAAVSRIYLDADTARAQAKALTRIFAQFAGNQRMRMLVVDDNGFLQDRTRFNARAAGILGFSNFGRDHLYLLDAQLQPDWDALEAWLSRQPEAPVFLFGFTFIVWQSLVMAARRDGRRFQLPPGSLLVQDR